MKPCLVIPVHNRRELTLGCLRHLAALGELARHDAIVVDDGSTDGTADAVRHEFGSVQLLRGDGTLWWTGAIAMGMRHAFNHGAPAVCWLNDDCLPDNGTLPGLAAHADSDPLSLVTPSCTVEPTREAIPVAFVGRRAIATSDEPVRRVDGVSGFCVWISREVWARVGVPDASRFPHYFGDTSYSLQVQRAGGHATLLTHLHARLVRYVPRSVTIAEFVRAQRARAEPPDWRATFVSPRSPFRLATQWHYLRLRYGALAGSALAFGRLSAWQFAWARARLVP